MLYNGWAYVYYYVVALLQKKKTTLNLQEEEEEEDIWVLVNMESGWMHHQHHGLCNNREADTQQQQQQQRDTFTYVKIYNSFCVGVCESEMLSGTIYLSAQSVPVSLTGLLSTSTIFPPEMKYRY